MAIIIVFIAAEQRLCMLCRRPHNSIFIRKKQQPFLQGYCYKHLYWFNRNTFLLFADTALVRPDSKASLPRKIGYSHTLHSIMHIKVLSLACIYPPWPGSNLQLENNNSHRIKFLNLQKTKDLPLYRYHVEHSVRTG